MPPSVLVVDDDPLVCSFYQALFANTAYQVRTQRYPPTHLAHLQRDLPDLIVVEPWYRNHPHGWAFVYQLRQHPLTRSLPILLCTARWDLATQYAQDIHSLDVAVVFKPFDIAQFFATLDQLIGLPGTQCDLPPPPYVSIPGSIYPAGWSWPHRISTRWKTVVPESLAG